MAVMKKTVAYIPAQIQYDKHIRVEQKTLRVAAYCRVSTLLEQQEGSYEAQVDYYTEKSIAIRIGSAPEYLLTMVLVPLR